jgi:hypothetical protein
MKTRIEELQKIAEGREAEMFAWEQGRVLRLYRGGFQRSTVEFQTDALNSAREAGVRVPAVYGTTEVDGRFGVIMERIAGSDLLTVIGRQPWRVWWVAGITGRAQAEINSAEAPSSLPTTHERYRRIMTNSDSIPDDLARAALARLEELPLGDRLIHGDFHPGNVMLQDGEPVVLDWSNASRGDPDADFERSQLIVRLGDPPPGTAMSTRLLAKVGRRLLLDSWARSYRKVRMPDETRRKAWQLPIATARLAEGIEVERPALLRFIRRQLPDASDRPSGRHH